MENSWYEHQSHLCEQELRVIACCLLRTQTMKNAILYKKAKTGRDRLCCEDYITYHSASAMSLGSACEVFYIAPILYYMVYIDLVQIPYPIKCMR